MKKQKISLNEASNRAVAFLKKNGYETKGLEIDESAQYNNIGVFSFIPVEKNVRIYPEAIRMKVALDDGEVVGFPRVITWRRTARERFRLPLCQLMKRKRS